MPRRRALTAAQLETLFALPAAEADLIRYWTLDRDAFAAIDRRRGAANQFGYALQLCAFRYPGRLLHPGAAIPETALRFIAGQIHVSADALGAYAARLQTRREQLDGLRAAFGFRMYAPGNGREMLAWLLPMALATTDARAICPAAPTDPFQQHRQLRRRQRHHAVLRLRPDEAPAFEPFGEQAHSLTVPEQQFHQIAAAAAKDEQVTAERVLPEHLLH